MAACMLFAQISGYAGEAAPARDTAFGQSAQWPAEEIGMAPRIAEPVKAETPDGCHFAAVSVTVDDERQVYVDGKPGAKYPMVKEDSLRITPDGKHVGYVAGRGDFQFAVIDGKAGPEYGAVANVTFSADGKQVAYAALKTNKECIVVVNGVEGPAYQAIIGQSPVVSSAGGRVAYGARKDNKWLVWDNGKESASYDKLGHLVVSSNGAVSVFQGRNGKSWATVIDGLSSTPYEGGGPLALSADGRKVAYAVWRGKQCFVWADGRLGQSTDGLVEGGLSYSPDGKRLAYKAALGTKRVVVADGKEIGEYDGVAKGPVTWSADSKRLGFHARKGDKWILVVDGVESEVYEGLSLNSPVFSLMGTNTAYGVVKGDTWSYVINGVKSPVYDALGSLAFKPDGKGVAYSAKSGKAFVHVNGKNSPAYKTIACGPVWRRDGTVEFLALDEQDRLFRVTHKP